MPSSTASSVNIEPKQKHKKRIPKLRIKRKKKQNTAPYDQVIIDTTNTPIATEQTSLVIHAEYRKPSTTQRNLQKAKKLLYASHFVAKFSELGWQFCLILFLTALTNYKSLALVSTYGLFSGIVVCLTGSSAGAFVDSKNRSRLSIAKLFIWVQNLSVIIATTCCFCLLRIVPTTSSSQSNGDINMDNISAEKIESTILPDLAPSATLTTWCLLIAVHIFGACGKLTDASMTVAMERDWIVVMSKVAGTPDSITEDDDDSDQISKNNSSDNSDEEYYNLEKSQSENSDKSDFSTLSAGDATLGTNTELNDGVLRGLKEKTWLSQTNTVMKQIDLICKVAAPAAAGIFFACFDNYKPGSDDVLHESHWQKLSYAALIIGILNLMSLFLEYHFMKQIYDLVPLLATRKSVDGTTPKVAGKGKKVTSFKGSDDDNDMESSRSDLESGKNKNKFELVLSRQLSTVPSGVYKEPSTPWAEDTSKDQESSKDNKNLSFRFCFLPRGLDVYMRQPIFFGGFALSLLYLNILTFGALMTAYLVWRGMTYEAIGALRGVSSLIGLLGTVAYHISARRHTISFTGGWSIMFQFSCLSICYASLYVSNDGLSLIMLIIGVIASRIGLYVFDLAITQLMQQMIPEDIRGVMGGVQKSLNSFFDLTTYGLGLIFSDPNDFHILVATGFTSVGIAMCFYLWGIHRYKDEIQKVM